MSYSSKRRDSNSSDVSNSRIPVSYTPSLPRKQRPSLNRHRSLQCLNQRLSPRTPDEDTESLKSGYSGCSLSSQCDHAHFARNGTTYSGKDKRFIVHCSPTHVEPDKYLTPTQRANATIKRLQSALSDSQAELANKEQEIAKLTKELVQLRLVKAETQPLTNGHSPPGGGDARLSVETTPCSLADSGHFEDISPQPSPRNTPNGDREINKLKSQFEDQVRSLQEAHNAKIETLVQRLTEANDKYYELKPQYDQLQKKIEELEKEKVELENKFKESEERHKNTYLQMFNKGQEAALFSVDSSTTDGPSPVDTIPALLKQLEVTKSELESVKDVDYWERARSISGKEAVSIWNLCRKTMYRRLLESRKPKSDQDAEVTLQFLKSAVYYFLTDRENTTGHLAAIQSILGFTREERSAIERATAAYLWK